MSSSTNSGTPLSTLPDDEWDDPQYAGPALTFAELLAMRADAPDESIVQDLTKMYKERDNARHTRNTFREMQREFEWCGMRVVYTLHEEKHPLWRQVLQEKGPETKVTWELTGDEKIVRHVGDARLYLHAGKDESNPIWLFSTEDGPIVALDVTGGSELRHLEYPALLQHEKGRIKLNPIFGASKYLSVKESSIRSVQAPPEALLVAYPGFVLQCKMGAFDPQPVNMPPYKEIEKYSFTTRCK